MALTNMPMAPTVSGVYSFRDSSQQLAGASDANAKALQNAFSFGTKVYDFLKSRKQAGLMKKDREDRAALEESIKQDRDRLALLQKDLATLTGGV